MMTARWSGLDRCRWPLNCCRSKCVALRPDLARPGMAGGGMGCRSAPPPLLPAGAPPPLEPRLRVCSPVGAMLLVLLPPADEGMAGGSLGRDPADSAL